MTDRPKVDRETIERVTERKMPLKVKAVSEGLRHMIEEMRSLVDKRPREVLRKIWFDLGEQFTPEEERRARAMLAEVKAAVAEYPEARRWTSGYSQEDAERDREFGLKPRKYYHEKTSVVVDRSGDDRLPDFLLEEDTSHPYGTRRTDLYHVGEDPTGTKIGEITKTHFIWFTEPRRIGPPKVRMTGRVIFMDEGGLSGRVSVDYGKMGDIEPLFKTVLGRVPEPKLTK